VPINKEGDKTDCNNYRGISLLLTSYNILSNILLSRLSPYIDEIIGLISMGFDVTDQRPISFNIYKKFSFIQLYYFCML
jgi:hypothetical protein